jgi:hypothetical protein
MGREREDVCGGLRAVESGMGMRWMCGAARREELWGRVCEWI